MLNYRLARLEDAAALLEIYRPAIEESAISFEETSPSVEEFAARICDAAEERPWLVVELDNQVAGYAYASRFRERSAYRWCAESAIYVASWAQQRGVGAGVYQKLMEQCRLRRITTLMGVITLPNEASIRLHEKLGFQHTGTWPRCGHKLGRWWDVGVWTAHLGDMNGDIEEPRPYHLVPAQERIAVALP